MLVLKTRKEIQNHLNTLRNQPETSIGFVPTMGALHKGHLSLLKYSLTENTHTVVSIFVNPTQFNNPEDLKTYPKPLKRDLELLKAVNPNIIVFTPTPEELYSENIESKKYDFRGLDKVMEGAFRPGHFEGVATVLEIFFKTIRPNRAYFGEKDYQQLQIIREINRHLDLDISIVGCPILRQESGLAMSSRNERLSDAQKSDAALIFKTLNEVKARFPDTTNLQVLSDLVTERFAGDDAFDLEYFQIACTDALQQATQVESHLDYRAFIAVYMGDVRLIDNIALN